MGDRSDFYTAAGDTSRKTKKARYLNSLRRIRDKGERPNGSYPSNKEHLQRTGTWNRPGSDPRGEPNHE